MKKAIAVLSALLMGYASSACSLLYMMFNAEPMGDAMETTSAAEEQENFTEYNLSGEEDSRVLSVQLRGSGANRGRITPSNNVMHKDVVGRFGTVVDVQSSDLTDASLVFVYDPQHMDNIPPDNLIVLHYDEEEAFYITLDSTLDETAHTVTANITEGGAYMLADSYQWYGAWGVDVSEYAHDTVYQNDEFQFEITIPEEILSHEVSSYLADDEDGKCKTLLECDKNDTIQIGIEYLERPYSDSVKAFANDIAKSLDKQGYLQEAGTITEAGGRTGYYCYSDFGDGSDHAYSINCFFPLSDTQYINIWYGFKDVTYLEKAMDSLHSFRFLGETEVPQVSGDYEFDDYQSTFGRDISVPLPDDLQWIDVNEDWEQEMIGDRVLAIVMPIKRIIPNGCALQQGIVMLEDCGKNARAAAEAALNDHMSRLNTELRDTEQIKIKDDQYGCLFSIVHYDEICLEGYFNIPDTYQYTPTHQYIHVWLQLKPDVSDADYQKYWDCLKQVDTAKPDAAITAEQLKIDFPENFYVTSGHDFGWWYEDDNQGDYFYRKYLLDTDHNRNSQAGNHDVCGAFFYLHEYDDQRTAEEARDKREENLMTNRNLNYKYADSDEFTMPCGQKGYLFSVRAEADTEGYTSSCYMYGYYELTDAEGNPSPQFVEIEFMLNEPLSDEAYQAYWNCLKSVDILKPDSTAS